MTYFVDQLGFYCFKIFRCFTVIGFRLPPNYSRCMATTVSWVTLGYSSTTVGLICFLRHSETDFPANLHLIPVVLRVRFLIVRHFKL